MDIDALRAATPGCTGIAHFNHSAASLPSRAVLTAIREQMELEATRGPIESAAAATARIEDLRIGMASLLNATPQEIAFTDSGASAWGLAFSALPALRAGDRVLVGRHEWGGNLATLHVAAQRVGARVEVIDGNEDGSVSTAALSQLLDERVRLVALTWLPANGGLVNPAAEIGRLCRAAGVPFFIDAGQALGQVATDVRALACDVLVGAGRKHLRGPRGTGILFVRREFLPTLQPAFLDVLSAPWGVDGPVLRDDARLFEKGEASLALLLGLGVAVRDTLALGVPAIQARIGELAGSLRTQLRLIQGVQMLDLGRTHSGIVSFNVAGHDAVEVRQRLSGRRINVAANQRAYTPLDMAARGLDSVVRASLSYVNTEAEVTRLVEAIDELARR